MLTKKLRYAIVSIFVASIVIMLFNAFATPQTMAESLLSRKEVEELVVRQAEAWENQDAKAIADDFAEDAVFIAAGFKFVGQQRIEKAALDYFKQFHNTTVEIKNIIVDGERGAVEWDWRDRKRQGNLKGFAEDAIIFELVDGKITYWREYIEKKKPT